jgi:hypothetical protein
VVRPSRLLQVRLTFAVWPYAQDHFRGWLSAANRASERCATAQTCGFADLRPRNRASLRYGCTESMRTRRTNGERYSLLRTSPPGSPHHGEQSAYSPLFRAPARGPRMVHTPQPRRVQAVHPGSKACLGLSNGADVVPSAVGISSWKRNSISRLTVLDILTLVVVYCRHGEKEHVPARLLAMSI